MPDYYFFHLSHFRFISSVNTCLRSLRFHMDCVYNVLNMRHCKNISGEMYWANKLGIRLRRSCSKDNFKKEVLKFIISFKNIIQNRCFKSSLEPPQRKRLWWRLEHLACRPPYSPPKITVKPLPLTFQKTFTPQVDRCALRSRSGRG